MLGYVACVSYRKDKAPSVRDEDERTSGLWMTKEGGDLLVCAITAETLGASLFARMQKSIVLSVEGGVILRETQNM